MSFATSFTFYGVKFANFIQLLENSVQYDTDIAFTIFINIRL